MIWHIAQVSPAAERRVIRGLRENGFTVVQPCLTVWKSVPKGPRERIKTPMFPGYVFLGQPEATPFDRIHDPRTPVRIIPNGWRQEPLGRLICDFAFRELAGEFDKTQTETYRPGKPMTGPLSRSLGHGMSALKTLLITSDSGRLGLLFSGELFEDGEPITGMDAAA